LSGHELIVPVAGVTADELLDTFHDRRGNRMHGALDIPAPRGTPVLSADDGRVLKLHTSRGGGLTVYVADPTEQFVYFYAHLDGYRQGLAEGQRVRKGDVLGYVGTTGNAPPNLPHLHFAITRTEDVSKWWRGTPIDPRPLLRAGA
jgi:murein DD-endopeptidase MepM/ murein hydrolase activator NlpD